MPTTKTSSRKHGAKVTKSSRGTDSKIFTKRRATNSESDGLEELDEDTLLSFSMDTPARLTPPPGNGLISYSSPMPLLTEQYSTDVMQATLDRLGFGPPNDLSNLPISPTPAPTTPKTSTMEMLGEDETASEPVLTSVESSDADDVDAYCQITKLFHQVARRTGQSVNVLILEWALLHAHTDLAKRRVAHAHMSAAMAARQQAFDEETDKIIEIVRYSFFSSTSFVIDYCLTGK